MLAEELVGPVGGRELPGHEQGERLTRKSGVGVGRGEQLTALDEEEVLHEVGRRCVRLAEGVQPQVGQQAEGEKVGQRAVALVDHVELGAVRNQLPCRD